MGLCLIAAGSGIIAPVINILLVVFALGMVIFVHELGHFLVAKLCGVKCQKFYLGFDIFGWKLCKFTWGETEYGVGVLPLGGYVKMLGQEDNPARLREELERAQAKLDHSTPHADDHSLNDDSSGDADSDNNDNDNNNNNNNNNDNDNDHPIDIEAAKAALFDPRSYLAQSVPERMAIISAGVFMNIVFALVAGVIAYHLGVEQIDSTVGALTPGDSAWQLDVRVGDRIEAINGEPIHRFMDIKKAISLGDNLEQGVTLSLRRPGVEELIEVTVEPDRTGLAPTIGVGTPRATTLMKEYPAYPGSAAADAQPGLKPEDRIVAIDGKPVQRYAEIFQHLAQNPDKTIELTVRRKVQDDDASDSPNSANNKETEREHIIHVAPRPMQRLGLVMSMGPIVAVQRNSPAAKAGIRKDDQILEIDGQASGDPMTLPDRLRRLAEQASHTILTIARSGQTEPLEIEVALRPSDSFDSFVSFGDAVSVPALGLAYQVGNRVESVLESSPAARASVPSGAVVVGATITPPDRETLLETFGDEHLADFPSLELDTIEFSREKPNWPFLFHILQTNLSLPGTKVSLDFEDGSHAELALAKDENWFNPDRGFLFNRETFSEKGETLGESCRLGFHETTEALTMVFRTIKKLTTRQVSPRLLVGPWGIAETAYYSASAGMSPLLIFLCLISANLAVINFLPIPVLDGGHMVFLAYEGIRGKPPSEAVQVWLSYLGLALLLSLMILVISLDAGFISRQ